MYEKANARTRVFSEETAYLTTDMLKTTAQTGTAKKLRALNLPIAGKTGTVGTEKGNTDAYAISYTALNTVGVWLGNKDNSFIPHVGGGMPCNFLYAFNERLSREHERENMPITDFVAPKNVRTVALDKVTYENEHTLLLADSLAPAKYRFSEIFSMDCVPTQTSEIFSNPTIITPSVRYDGENILLIFEKEMPLYEYKIERYDFTKRQVIYQGKSLKTFIDYCVEKNKNYVYTVTPIFKERQGTPVALPTISTKVGASPPQPNPEILQKDWWEY